MASVTLSTLRTDVLARAQMDSDDPGAVLLDRNINAAIKHIREVLLRHRQAGMLVNSTPSTFTTSEGVQTVSLPDDFEGLAGIDIQVSGVWRVAIEFDFADRHLVGTETPWAVLTDGRINARYCLLGDKLFFQDPPDGAYSGRIWHVPVHTELAAPADTINLWGHDDVVVDYAAMRCLDDDNLPSDHLARLVADWDRKIERLAKRRNRGSHKTTRDVTGATANLLVRDRNLLP